MHMLDTLSFRIFTDYPGNTPEKVEQLVNDCITYTQSNLMQIDLSNSPVVTVGCHRDTGREHIHISIQYLSPLWKDHKKGASAHRKAWFVANQLEHPKGQDLTMTLGLAKSEDEANNHLSYPFKEGIVCPHPGNSEHGSRLEFLIARGKGLYEAERKAKADKLARESKAKNIVSQLLDITKSNLNHSNDPLEIRSNVLTEFYAQFDTPLNYPNGNDVKNAWQKVSIFLRIVPVDYYL